MPDCSFQPGRYGGASRSYLKHRGGPVPQFEAEAPKTPLLAQGSSRPRRQGEVALLLNTLARVAVIPDDTRV